MAKSELEILIKARNQAKAEFDKLNKQVTGLQGSTGGLGGKLKTLDAGFQKLTGVSLASGGAIGVASMAVKKMYEYSQVAINAASDLSETESKVGVVFGDQADAMLKWGESAAEAMGMSANEALAAAGTYGNLFRAMGIGVDVSAEMSQNLVQLASDLASFNNMNPDEVLDKLRAGLSGEVEPLRSLGVNLNQALIQQEALNLGIWDGVGAIDAAQKAQASYSLILKQTTLAQGDFDRTSEGLANQQRILAAAQEDLAATIGEYLLPTKTALVETKANLTIQLTDYVRGLKDERDQIERLGLVYDQHIGYMKDGVLLTAEQVNEMKRADRANQAWTDSLNAQAEAWFELHPELRQGIEDYQELAESGENYYRGFQTFARQEEDYAKRIENVRINTRELMIEKQRLLDNGYSPESEAVQNISNKIHDQEIAARDLAEEHRIATQSIILGFIEQELAIDGLSKEEAEFLIDMGVEWGIYEKDMITAYDNARASVEKFRDEQGKIITDQHVKINIDINWNGEFNGIGGAELAAGVDLNGNGIIGAAKGADFTVPRGYPNDSLLIGVSSGEHVNVTPAPGAGGGAKTIIFNYSPAFSLSDRAEVETKIRPMLKELLSEV